MLQKRNILDKIVKKNYNNELEEVLETKHFDENVQSTLLGIMYKIEAAYKDLETVKKDVQTKEEYISNLIEIIKNEYGSRLTKIPTNSRYIKSEEILYEIRKIQQDAVLQESIESTITKERGRKNAKVFLKTKEGGKQFPRFAFAQDKYSNGETTLQILEEDIEPDKLYLLDEPEVSLSPQNQVKLAEKINEMARYLGVQFVIATHSPFMLGILNAKIYNLDTKDYRVEKWNELENVRYFYNFFKSKKEEFEDYYKKI